MSGTHLENKKRITCMVSDEVEKMWNEIVAKDKKKSNKRYYPTHTLERIIKAEYELMKAFRQ